MKTEISSDQIKQYSEDGFIIIEDFLSPRELKEWRGAVAEAVNNRAGNKLPDRRSVGTLDDDEKYYDKVFIQRLNLWKDNPRMKGLILNPQIGKMATELGGLDGVRCWHDQALIKPPWGNSTAWHLDTPFWSFFHPGAMSIWVALDDATEQNGCLHFMKGSHHHTTFENPGITNDMDSIFKFYSDYKDVMPASAAMKAGSCSFHNGLTIHGAGANMTPYPRRAMTCAFMPLGAKFDGLQNILSDQQFAALTIGDEMNNEEQNPLIYKK
jgi:ectoine hydroxylase-related dioxygenase (phytanoyl-CoA dioxygenase family)